MVFMVNHQIIEESWDVTPVTDGGGGGTDGKWKIEQCSGRQETAIPSWQSVSFVERSSLLSFSSSITILIKIFSWLEPNNIIFPPHMFMTYSHLMRLRRVC